MAQSKYAGTGAADSAGSAHFVTLNKEGKFVTKDGVLGSVISGFVEGVDIVFDKGNIDHNIDAGWAFVLKVKGFDPEGTPDPEDGTPVTTWPVKFSMIGRSRIASTINALLATDVSWDGYVSLNGWAKEKGAGYSIKTGKNQGPKDTPVAYPWNEETNKGYVGVPEAAFIAKVQGRDIYAYSDQMNFWLRHAMTLYARFNGKPYTGEVGFLANNQDSYTATYTGVKATEGVAPAAAPTPVAPSAPVNPKDTYDTWLERQFELLKPGYTLESVNKLFINASKQEVLSKCGYNIQDVIGYFNAIITQNNLNMTMDLKSMVFIEFVENNSPADDLPF